MTTLRNWIDTVFFGVRWLYAAGTAIAERNAVNFVAPISAVDNPTTKRTDISVPVASSASSGLLPATAVADTVLCVDADGDPTWVKLTDDHIDDDAAIAGTKISPDFGDQAVATTSSCTAGTLVATTSCTAPALVATSYVAIGASPADAGAARFTNNQDLAWRNAAGEDNVLGLTVNTGDEVQLGDTTNPAGVRIDVATGESVFVDVDGTTVLEVDGTGATITGDLYAAGLVSLSLVSDEGNDLAIGVPATQTLTLEVDATPVVTVGGDLVTCSQPLQVGTLQGAGGAALGVHSASGQDVEVGVDGTPVVTVKAALVEIAQQISAALGITAPSATNLNLAAPSGQELGLRYNTTELIALLSTGLRFFADKIRVIPGAVSTSDGTATTFATYAGAADKVYGTIVVALSTSTGFGNKVGFVAEASSWIDAAPGLAEGPNGPDIVFQCGAANHNTAHAANSGLNRTILAQVTGSASYNVDWWGLLIVFELPEPS